MVENVELDIVVVNLDGKVQIVLRKYYADRIVLIKVHV
jgi:hypothetical protein